MQPPTRFPLLLLLLLLLLFDRPGVGATESPFESQVQRVDVRETALLPKIAKDDKDDRNPKETVNPTSMSLGKIGAMLFSSTSSVRWKEDVGDLAVRQGPFRTDLHCPVDPARAQHHRVALCGIVLLRYEINTILHWTTYHLMLGVDHIFLYVDDTHPTAQTSAERAVVTALRKLKRQVTVAYISKLGGKKKQTKTGQAAIYRQCQKAAKAAKFDWVGEWDGDEYLTAGQPPLRREEFEAVKNNLVQHDALPFDLGAWLECTPHLYRTENGRRLRIESVAFFRVNLKNQYDKKGDFRGLEKKPNQQIHFEGALAEQFMIARAHGEANRNGKILVRADSKAISLSIHRWISKKSKKRHKGNPVFRNVVAAWPWLAVAIETHIKRLNGDHPIRQAVVNSQMYYSKVKANQLSPKLFENARRVLNGTCTLATLNRAAAANALSKAGGAASETPCMEQQLNLIMQFVQNDCLNSLCGNDTTLENAYLTALREYRGPRLVHFESRSVEQCEQKKKDWASAAPEGTRKPAKGDRQLGLQQTRLVNGSDDWGSVMHYTHRKNLQCEGESPENGEQHWSRLKTVSDNVEFSLGLTSSLVNKELVRWFDAVVVKDG